MDIFWIFVLGFYLENYQCNSVTMRDGFGRSCIEIVKTYLPRPNIIPSRFGPISAGRICDDGILVGDRCEKRYLTAKKK